MSSKKIFNVFFLARFPLAYASKDFLKDVFKYKTIEEIIIDIENEKINDKILNACLENGISGFGTIEEDVFEIAEKRLIYAFTTDKNEERKIYNELFKPMLNYEESYSPAEIYFSFIIAKYILCHFPKPYWHYFSEKESEIAKRMLLKELLQTIELDSIDLYNVQKSLKTMLEELGMKIKFVNEFPVKFVLPKYINIVISVPQYLKFTYNLKFNKSWRLYKKIVFDGNVFLSFKDFSRIFKEHYKHKLISTLQYIEEPFNETIKEIRDKLLEKYKTRYVKRKEYSDENVELVFKPEALPPCMKSIYEKLISGINLSHAERFHFCAFLVNIGMDVEEILSIFSNLPDFNEKIARYQIEHIAGLKGSRKKYKPGSCRTLLQNNICINKDELCNKVNHPLTYYKIKLRLMKNDS